MELEIFQMDADRDGPMDKPGTQFFGRSVEQVPFCRFHKNHRDRLEIVRCGEFLDNGTILGDDDIATGCLQGLLIDECAEVALDAYDSRRKRQFEREGQSDWQSEVIADGYGIPDGHILFQRAEAFQPNRGNV